MGCCNSHSGYRLHMVRYCRRKTSWLLWGVVILLFCITFYISINVHNVNQRKTDLVVLILTDPINRDTRDTIRQTWLSGPFRKTVSLYFAVGSKLMASELLRYLEDEASKHQDLIILPDLEDSYGKLTEKVLQSFVWLAENVLFDFVFKCDDDTFARIDVLLDELSSLPSRGLYWGFFDGRAGIKTEGAWAERQWVLCDTYLPYARGGGYVLSSDIVDYIARNSHFLKQYRSEDVSVGSWLAPLKITRVHDVRFDTEYKSRGCLNKYIVTHKQSINDMTDKYYNIRHTGLMCSVQFEERNSYMYDWNAPPSECCNRNLSDSDIIQDTQRFVPS